MSMICWPIIGCDMIKVEENYFIKDRHTFHMPVYTKWFVEYETVEELVTLLQSDLLREHTFFPIGGGSNLLFVKEMYNGVLLHSAIQGMAVSEETDTEVLVEIGAGVVWDDFVAWTVSNGGGEPRICRTYRAKWERAPFKT